MGTTVKELLNEMSSFVHVPENLLLYAENSKITTENNVRFETLVDDWSSGRYDEDPDYVVLEIEQILED